MSRAHLDKPPKEVATMFDQVAKAYDITNDVLSLGQTRRWRKIVQSVINPQPGDYILDLAAGTGSSSLPLADAGATVIPCDFQGVKNFRKAGIFRIESHIHNRTDYLGDFSFVY